MRALIPLLLLGCGNDKAAEDSAPDADCACAITAAAVYPPDGAVDAYYRSAVEFSLSEPDPTATVTLTDASGAAVPGALSFDEGGDVVTFTPDEFLAPSSEYTAQLDWCGGCEPRTAQIGFTTSALGTPLAVDLTGKTYLLDLTAGRMREPKGWDFYLGLLHRFLLLGVQSAGEGLELRLACSQEDAAEQGTCFPTIESFSADFSQAPFFADPPETGDILLECAFPPVHQAALEGTFTADGASIGNAELRGTLDARELQSILFTAPDTICEELGTYGTTCAACESDGESYCFPFHVDQLTADEIPIALEPIAAAQCHEDCEASCENAECPEADEFPVCQP